MLSKLKARWKVNGLNLLLIIATFTLGGSLCGYAGRKILLLTNLEQGFAWILLYVILVTILWPVCVLLISIPLGQFAFFKRYISKIWKRFNLPDGQKTDYTEHKESGEEPAKIAIFASGAGSNAEQIIIASGVAHLQHPGKTKKAAYVVALIVCNKPDAGVLKIADKRGIPVLIIEKEKFFSGDNYLPVLHQYQINFIVLAGFLWKIPAALIHAYPKKIINIHPALLPKYGGKGMYGDHVHASVIANKEKESGISIHYVDELYDHGEIIFQATCTLDSQDTARSLAQKIQVLEHQHYPAVLRNILQKQNRS